MKLSLNEEIILSVLIISLAACIGTYIGNVLSRYFERKYSMPYCEHCGKLAEWLSCSGLCSTCQRKPGVKQHRLFDWKTGRLKAKVAAEMKAAILAKIVEVSPIPHVDTVPTVKLYRYSAENFEQQFVRSLKRPRRLKFMENEEC